MSDQKYGVENLKVLAADLAEALNVASKEIHGGGLLGLWGALGIVSSLKGLNWAQVKLEVSEVSTDERVAVEKAFASALQLQDPNVQAKILAGEGFLERAISLVSQAVTLEQEVVKYYGG